MTSENPAIFEGHMALPPDIDGILEAVKTILKMGNVQLLKMDLTDGIMYQRIVSDVDTHPFDTDKSLIGLEISDIIRQRPVEEAPFNESNMLGSEQFIHAMIFMHLKDYVVTHIVLGPGTKFWKWLCIDTLSIARITHVCGAKIEMDKTLSVDRAILCGARTRTATTDEISYSLALFMEVAE